MPLCSTSFSITGSGLGRHCGLPIDYIILYIEFSSTNFWHVNGSLLLYTFLNNFQQENVSSSFAYIHTLTITVTVQERQSSGSIQFLGSFLLTLTP